MNNTGQIVRAKVTRDFTVVPNEIIQSKTLSLEEKGLMTYLLSLPQDWVVFKSNLHRSIGEKKGKVDRVFGSLQQKGYILSTKSIGSDGKFMGWNHIVYENPVTPENTEISPTHSFTDVGDLPKSVFTEIGESAPIQNTNSIQNTNNTQIGGKVESTTDDPEHGGEESRCLETQLFKPRSQESKIEESVTADIIQFFNDLTGMGYKAKTKSTILLVKARLKDGFVLEDMKTVVRDRAKKWLHDPKMVQYLRPETVFGNKFEGYLQAAKLDEPKTTQTNPTEDAEW